MAFLVLILCKKTKEISYDGNLLISMTLNKDVVRVFKKVLIDDGNRLRLYIVNISISLS